MLLLPDKLKAVETLWVQEKLMFLPQLPRIQIGDFCRKELLLKINFI